MRIKILAAASNESAPKGKRSIKRTVYGNTNAYISGKFWRTLGESYAAGTDEAAEKFLSGEID